MEEHVTTAYHICHRYTGGKDLSTEIMKSLIIQLLQKNVELAAYAFEDYANKGFRPSVLHLKALLKSLVQTIPATRIFIDGLDEYPASDQRSILIQLLELTKSPNIPCRVLFSSRDVGNIRRALQNKPTINFRDEKEMVERDIKAYVHSAISELRDVFKSHPQVLDDIENTVISKADGKSFPI